MGTETVSFESPSLRRLELARDTMFRASIRKLIYMLKFNKQSRIHPCHFSKSELETLVSLIKTDFPESNREEDFKIRTYSDTIDITEHSLENFLGHDRLPPTLSRLMIGVIGWSDDREINKSFDLTFSDNYIDLRVSGVSESWVNGKYIQITNFLKAKRPLLWFLHSPAIYVIRGGIFVIIVAGAAFLIYQWYMNGFDSVNILIPLSVLFFSILDSMIGKHKYTQIFLTEQRSFSERYKDLVTIVGLLASVTTIMIFLLTLLQK
jgi:uncharacterized membrane protein YvlD (DUF360 family)